MPDPSRTPPKLSFKSPTLPFPQNRLTSPQMGTKPRGVGGKTLEVNPLDSEKGERLLNEHDCRAQEALEARADGLSWRQVAQRLGYSNGGDAMRAVRRYANRGELSEGRAAERAEWLQRLRRKAEKFERWASKPEAPVASLADTIARTLEIEGQAVGALTAQRAGSVSIQNQVVPGNPGVQPGDDLAGADEREIRDLLRAVSSSDQPPRDLPGT